MIVRFGFVAMSLTLENASPSKTITLKNLDKLEKKENKISRLGKIAQENLHNSLRVIRHCVAHEIPLYRFSSKLIPLATHPITEGWDYVGTLNKELKALGQFIKDKDLRVSAHPDHYTVLNTPNDDVFSQALADLNYHLNLFKGMGLDTNNKLVIHIGGVYGNKGEAIQRFINRFSSLDEEIQNALLLENDDKSYTARDVLNICQTINRPMVFDVHHHLCLTNGEKVRHLLPDIFATWNGRLPKIHFSSPKSDKAFRHHADEIDLHHFLAFLEEAKSVNLDFDVMIEAKNKDLAVFHLLKGLEKEGITLLTKGSIEL